MLNVLDQKGHPETPKYFTTKTRIQEQHGLFYNIYVSIVTNSGRTGLVTLWESVTRPGDKTWSTLE